jgi:hypothetical protein
VPLDDFNAAVWCPSSGAPQALIGFTLVEAKGTSWLATPGTSPEPGTTLYAFDAPGGPRVVVPQPALTHRLNPEEAAYPSHTRP